MQRIFFLILAILPGPLMAGQLAGASPDASLSAALNQIAYNNVERVTIFYMPEDVETYIPIQSRELEQGFWSSVSIRVIPEARFGPSMISALLQSSMKPAPNAPQNFRWECVFYDEKGQRLLSVYLSTNKFARINDIDVSTDDKFLNFLRRQFKYLTDNWK